MTSKRTKPQLVQNGIERRNPTKVMRKAMNPFGTPLAISKSKMTVEVASTMENAESIPRKNSVELNMKVQKLAHGMRSQAVGKATKAKPAEEVFDLARLFFASKYPTIAQTANPEMKLTELLHMQITILSRMIGFLTGL